MVSPRPRLWSAGVRLHITKTACPETQETQHYLLDKSHRLDLLEIIDLRAFASRKKVTFFFPTVVLLKRRIKTRRSWGVPGVAARPLTWLCWTRAASCQTAAAHKVFVSRIRCSDLLNRVHLLLISSSRSDHCGRLMFRSSWLTISVNQAHKREYIYLPWIIAEKLERNGCNQGTLNVLHRFSPFLRSLVWSITDRWLCFLFVCILFY